MHTLLPYADFRKSAQTLDHYDCGRYTRLGNQMWRETLTLVRGGWQNHVASRMWRGYTFALAQYGLALVDECEERLDRDYSHLRAEYQEWADKAPHQDMPWWLGDERVHATHRSNLLRKDGPARYGQYGWTEIPVDGYFWPFGADRPGEGEWKVKPPNDHIVTVEQLYVLSSPPSSEVVTESA